MVVALLRRQVVLSLNPAIVGLFSLSITSSSLSLEASPRCNNTDLSSIKGCHNPVDLLVIEFMLHLSNVKQMSVTHLAEMFLFELVGQLRC